MTSQYRILKLLNRFQIHHANIYYHAKFQSQGWLNTDFMKGGGIHPPHTCQIFKTPYHIGLKSRIIHLKRIVENLTKDLATGIRVQDFLKSLIGLHAITGCDTVSAFTGKGKVKALKLLMKSMTYVDAFMDLGISWNISEETVNAIERFACELYEKKM